MTIQAKEHKFSFEFPKVVNKIKELKWDQLNGEELQVVWYLHYIAAVEFSEALRISLRLYPNHEGLQEMAHGELNTKNLLLDDFTQAADHYEFLEHFLRKHNVLDEMNTRFKEEVTTYLEACRALSDEDRAMTVFSREDELSGIFSRILEAKDWSAPGLYAFKHYLSRHITLDMGDGGHHELTEDFPVNEKVLPFYQARYEAMKLVPKLFEPANEVSIRISA